MKIIINDNNYVVKNAGPKTDSGTQTEKKTVAATYSPIRKYGAPVLFFFPLLGVLALVIGRSQNMFQLSEIEREWLDYRNSVGEYTEWVSTGQIPKEARFNTTVPVESFVDLVDIAIDSNRRVIQDTSRNLCAVILDNVMYTYRAPEVPPGHTGDAAELLSGPGTRPSLASGNSRDAVDNAVNSQANTNTKKTDGGGATTERTPSSEDYSKPGPNTSQSYLEFKEPDLELEETLSAYEGLISEDETIKYQMSGDGGVVHEYDLETKNIEQPLNGQSLVIITDRKILLLLITMDEPEEKSVVWSKSIAYTSLKSVDTNDKLLPVEFVIEVWDDGEYQFKVSDAGDFDVVVEYIRAMSDCWQRVTTAVEDAAEMTEAMGEHLEAGKTDDAKEARETAMSKLENAYRYLDQADVDLPQTLTKQIEKAVIENRQVAVQDRVALAKTFLIEAEEAVDSGAYGDACEKYVAARDVLETARTIVQEADISEPTDIDAKLETIETKLHQIEGKPLALAEEACERANNADELEPAVEAWQDAFNHYRDVLTAGWGTDIDFGGDTPTIRDKIEQAVANLIDGRQRLADKYEQTGDIQFKDDPIKAIVMYDDAIEQLEQARQLSAEFRAGSTEEIEKQLDHITAKHSLKRAEEFIANLLKSDYETSRIDERAELELDRIATEAWQRTETRNASLSVDSSITIQADKTRLLDVFENLYRNAIKYTGSDTTVQVGTTADGNGFYVEDDGPKVPTLETDLFEQGVVRADRIGLGLSLNGTALGAHGWLLTVTNGTNNGARFEIRIDETTDSA